LGLIALEGLGDEKMLDRQGGMAVPGYYVALFILEQILAVI
jgi:hypothetical protein